MSDTGVVLARHPFTCPICGSGFDTNPRLRLWLTGQVPRSEIRKVAMCWVCAHLTASVEREAAGMSTASGGLENA